MTSNHEIDSLLLSLDAADRRSDARTPRARADLARILSTDPAPAPAQRAIVNPATGKVRSPGRKGRRAVLVGGLVAALTAGLVVIPSLSGGDPAFASWTPIPTGMSQADSDSAAAECRASKKGVGDGMYADDINSSEVAIAERRGVWTTVVLTGAGGFTALCITDDAATWFNKGMIGSVGKAAGNSRPGPRGLTASALGTGSMSAGDISIAAGATGSDVLGVVYRSRNHQDVTATVARGQFALWLPGDELRNASGKGIEVEVTYTDGSTGKIRLTL
ncbi:hypothetical protein [Sinomonas sp. R1AF57]|uniref:hypothetical protein n=1 Tax=Sinomonas sp. R1AF57 TaxID=2020377 RepID=UPI000B60B778|nr:hypothetical protein [Sinomonas sp. R1AF57]ASN53393.1 hypothetical protein CGQ25_15875 [Sinomonas sp. R1AF57]